MILPPYMGVAFWERIFFVKICCNRLQLAAAAIKNPGGLPVSRADTLTGKLLAAWYFRIS